MSKLEYDDYSQEFKELFDESAPKEHEREVDKPWQSAKEVKAHFFWGDRGSGKSTAMEETAVSYYKEGLNVWHIWGARSYENWFWCVNLNCRAKWMNAKHLPQEMADKLDDRLHCDCHEAFPTVLVFTEYKEVYKFSLLRYNGRVWKSIEEYTDAVKRGLISPEISHEERKLLYEGKLFKPDFLQPTRDLVTIAYVTIPKNTEKEEIFKKQWIKIVTDARKEHRVVALNPQIFEGDMDKFRVVGQIFKLVPDIADEFFQKLTEDEVGRMRGLDYPVAESEWTPEEKGWNKIVIVVNELRTIAPNSKFSPQKGATEAKRPIVDMIPELRHFGSGVWFMGDLQNPDDLNSSVRPQANNVVIKSATEDLLGKEFEKFFRRINEIRSKEFARWGFIVNEQEEERFVPIDVKSYVNGKFPRIEELTKNKGYVIFRNGEYFLETFGMPSFHHRREGESFRAITGIRWTLNKKKLDEDSDSGKSSAKGGGKLAKRETETKVLTEAVRLKKTGKEWIEVLNELKTMEANGLIPKTKVTLLTDKTLSNKVRKSPELVKLLESDQPIPETKFDLG